MSFKNPRDPTPHLMHSGSSALNPLHIYSHRLIIQMVSGLSQGSASYNNMNIKPVSKQEKTEHIH